MSNTQKARAAIKAEALSEAVEFEYDGLSYDIPAADDWPVAVLTAVEEGKAATFVRALLGPEQWAAFNAKPRTVRDLNGLAEALAEAAGLGN